jgi:hypothetical protein
MAILDRRHLRGTVGNIFLRITPEYILAKVISTVLSYVLAVFFFSIKMGCLETRQ